VNVAQRQLFRTSPPTRTAHKGPCAPTRVASLAPQLPYIAHWQQNLTTLVSMKTRPSLTPANNPASPDAPFLTISKGIAAASAAIGGRVYWQDETYTTPLLVHVPEISTLRSPGVIVVFFHGNVRTLERDVRRPSLVPHRNLEKSGGKRRAACAPQLAVESADSSAGQFVAARASSAHPDDRPATRPPLRRIRCRQLLQRCRSSSSAIAAGFLPTPGPSEVARSPTASAACSPARSAVYGELDNLRPHGSRIHRSGFFVSSYSPPTPRRALPRDS